ncbi:acetate--CoA ligase family protein [Roseomonas stagni]|uniref:Acetate--CoA ligase family protein n=1 Tax=Falsiroseomonas algicola TaxID=2716930 RepID=A0A6M1LVW3_9PROT|nr:acetate--CoA ligase family protein [Falsiroseomonas algicola]NGM23614.1 acetate--CoA ligase family protein [Falsiroseomonas algicola]
MRAPYPHAALRRLLHPASLAIIGASPREGSFGLRTLRNLRGFTGAIHPVNPRYDTIEGVPCAPSLAALPAVPDCVIVALGRDQAEATLADCIEAGIGGVILYASGYAETRKPELIALQARLAAMVEGTGTRLLGPNCLGATNYAIGARMMFGRMPEPRAMDAAAIGIVTQSGSVSMALAQAMERGVAVSHAIPVGNACDVGIADLIAYLAEDETCRAIAAVFEGVEHPRQLAEAAALAARAGKPLVIHKMAASEAGAEAALSHTGALAGNHAAYRAILEAEGAVMVDSLDAVMETARFLAKAGRPRGHGIGVVLASGGFGVAAADAAAAEGVPLPQPEGATAETLRAHVPEFGAARNPCDVTAMALNDDTAFEASAGAFLADPAYAALMVVYPYADPFGATRFESWKRLAARHGKPIACYWASEWLEGEGVLRLEAEPGIATFRTLPRLFAAIAAWLKREAALAERTGIAPTPPAIRHATATALRATPDRVLAERAAKALLAPYGIPVVPERLARTAAEAAAAATALGFPVALKAESADIPHKTEAGVIRLNLADAASVEAAFDAVMQRALAATKADRIAGVLVQPMVPRGLELLMGARIDPAFGPLVAFGFGGVMAELLRDTALLPAPFTPAAAEGALRRLKGAALLHGFRGAPPVDVPALAKILADFSRFVADHTDQVEEIDVNPLICTGRTITAVDALIVRR